MALSAKLPVITEAQLRWVKRNAFPLTAYRCKKDTWCGRCGHSFSNGNRTCPHCGAKFEVENSRKSKCKELYYTTILTTCKGYQVVRHFLAKRVSRKNRETEYSVNEAVQIWIDQRGQATIVARPTFYPSRYYDLWNFREPMSIKNGHARYDISSCSNKVCRVLPIIRRNGYNGDFCGIPPDRFFSLILSNPLAETLLKTGQIALFKHLSRGGTIRNEKAVWICNRDGYVVKDAPLWCDYIALLDYFGMDTHNAHYVCPENLQAAHDRLHRRKERILERQRIESKRKDAEKKERSYRKQKGKYFGILITSKEITAHVLSSVAEFLEEGETMHHCVFTNGYYSKKDTIVLSARDSRTNERIETVEFNTRSLKVVQSRGKFNKKTALHDEIVRLCERKLPALL